MKQQTYSAWDGKVVFTCATTTNLKSLIIEDLMKSLVPESEHFSKGSDAARIFANMPGILSRTKQVEFFNLGEEDDMLVALQGFYEFAKSSRDYRLIWDSFIQLDLEVHNTWMKALNETLADDLAAPPEIQPNAPPDETLDPNASASVTRSSKPSTRKPKR